MTQLVGILNITPDSFSDGGQYDAFELAIERAEQLFAEGAVFVDIGAESTRPNATPLTPEQEWQRLMPVVTNLIETHPGKLSVDTYHPETVAQVLELGDIIINDVTGMNNPAMVAAVCEGQASCIVSHLPGSDIQAAHRGDLVDDMQVVVSDLLGKAQLLESKGLRRDQIILDPGIGFGKTPELNQRLLGFAAEVPDYQVMIGYSRKRFLGDNRMELEPNLAAGREAIASGAAFLRVHDVAGHQSLL